MSRQASGPYILSWLDNLISFIYLIFSKGYKTTQGMSAIFKQKGKGISLKYFYEKSYLKFRSIKNNGLPSYHFWYTFA